MHDRVGPGVLCVCVYHVASQEDCRRRLGPERWSPSPKYHKRLRPKIRFVASGLRRDLSAGRERGRHKGLRVSTKVRTMPDSGAFCRNISAVIKRQGFCLYQFVLSLQSPVYLERITLTIWVCLPPDMLIYWVCVYYI
jgi:hypothetical protein